jgi:anaerobic magnesium-protoporphyrin IX monomethyl ester cyclase
VKVLLGHSYFLRFDPKLEEAMQPYPPLGTLIAAAQVRRAGHDVAVYDAMLEASTRGWHQMLESGLPDVAVLFEDNFNYLSKMCLLAMRDAAMEMAGAAAAAGIPVLVCGSDATDNASLYLDAGASVVMTGEGDLTLLELLDAFAEAGVDAYTSEGLRGVEGVQFRGSDGSVVRTPDRANMKDLDDLPVPAWDLVDVESYRQRWLERHGHVSWNLVTTRGCPYHCNWCAKPIWGQRYNARSPESVVDEIEALRGVAAPDHLWFADDIFGLKPRWIARYGELVRERGLATPFKCLSRPDLLVKGDTVEELAAAGCETVWIGAESGSQRILDAMEKGTTVGQIREAADRVHRAGFRIAFFLQFGYPGEDWDDIEATFELVRRAQPDDIGMSVAYPLPGTRFHERVLDQLGAVRNWQDSDDMAMLFEGPFSTAFYRRLHTTLHRDYRSRRTWWRIRAGEWPGGRQVLGAIRDRLLYPLERWRLRRLARGGPSTPLALPVELDPEAASVPTPQPVAPPRRR